MRNFDFKPGDIAWLTDWSNAPYRRPVVILRKTLCKDFSRWEQRNRATDGRTYARINTGWTWMVLDEGMQRIVPKPCLYKRQYKPRSPK